MKRGFSLIELLVALAVFSIMAALAYGGLNSIARTRGELAQQESDFGNLMRVVGSLDRDLNGAIARPLRGAAGQVLPALIGASDHIELTRLGFANPQAEPRSNLQRVFYELDGSKLERGRYAVLDRSANSTPQVDDLKVSVDDFRLRYFDAASGQWLDAWPPPQSKPEILPRAVQWQLHTKQYGGIGGTVELVSGWPDKAAGLVTPAPPAAIGTPLPPLPPPPGGVR
ncbi:MAG: type II secretion system minor pseudopilin GspJ [Proteobacteria bacterium]|nr:type II secretion system minor pseudopilin GspJ [Pseudomonadota bacterium]